jgi:hypothetical protein
VVGAGETDACAVGEESAALGRGWTRRTTRVGGGIDRQRSRPFKGGGGGQRREGGSGSGDATQHGGTVGPSSDRRAAPRQRPGRARAVRLCFSNDAPTRLMRGPRLVVEEGVRSGACVRRPEETWSGPSPDEQ